MSHQTYVIHAIRCDVCNDAEFEGQPGESYNEVRRQAKSGGWRIDVFHDDCPACHD